MDRFACVNGTDNLQIPEKLWKELDIETSQQLHLSADLIGKTAVGLAQSGWLRLPFCNTLCSEALGSKPVLSQSGARVKEPPYQNVEQLPQELERSTPRLDTMLRALGALSKDGCHVAYNIEGPFTLLCSMLPMNRVFSALRKPTGVQMLQTAEDWVSQYTALAVEQGAGMISFADPVATIDILGERMFTAIYVPCLKRLLARLHQEYPRVPIHLCGKLTQCLLDIGACSVAKWTGETQCETYGHVLEDYLQTESGGLIGHFCLNFLNAKRSYLELIEL